MNFLRERLRGGSPGQTVIFFALMMTLIASFMAVVIDVGLLVNERRDAQNDVDRAALAGALALTLDADPAAMAADIVEAKAKANEWATKNGIDLADIEIAFVSTEVYDCFSGLDPVPTGVHVTLTRPAPSFLIGILGITEWNVSAEATACTGRPQELSGFLPFAVSEEGNPCFDANAVPRFFELCDIVVDSNTSGLVGELGVDRAAGSSCDDGNGSADVLENNIIMGSLVDCVVNVDSIIANPGHNVGKTESGLAMRLSSEGLATCDGAGHAEDIDEVDALAAAPIEAPLMRTFRLNGDDIDDFFEVYEWIERGAPDQYLQEYTDCQSPRAVSVIIVHDFAVPDGNAGPKSYLVRGFAQMYIEGCSRQSGGGPVTFEADCDLTGGGKFTIHARMVNVVADPNSELGLDVDFGPPVTFLRN